MSIARIKKYLKMGASGALLLGFISLSIYQGCTKRASEYQPPRIEHKVVEKKTKKLDKCKRARSLRQQLKDKKNPAVKKDVKKEVKPEIDETKPRSSFIRRRKRYFREISKETWLYPTDNHSRSYTRPKGAGTKLGYIEMANWESYDRDTIDKLEDTAYVVHFTAKWCMICQMQHKYLHNEEVDKFADEHKVRLFTADMTDYSEELNKALKDYDRAGIPVYVFVDKKGKELIIDQIWSTEETLQHLENLK